MVLLIKIGLVVLFSLLLILLILWYENYKYPICRKCGHNGYSVRGVKGQVVCSEHGTVE